MRKWFVFSLGLLGAISSLVGQEDSKRLFVSAGIFYSNPSGELLLIRGNRKVVRTNFTNATSYRIAIGHEVGTNAELSLSIGFASYTYENKEDYTDGFKNYSSDNFNYIPLFLNYDRLFDLKNLKLILGAHSGMVFYRKQVNLLSELHLLNVPEDQWPPHPNILSPLDLKIHHSFGIGIHGGVRKDFSRKIFAEVRFSATYAPFVAEILNDPEDDGDEDVNLDSNPIDIGFLIGFRL